MPKNRLPLPRPDYDGEEWLAGWRDRAACRASCKGTAAWMRQRIEPAEEPRASDRHPAGCMCSLCS